MRGAAVRTSRIRSLVRVRSICCTRRHLRSRSTPWTRRRRVIALVVLNGCARVMADVDYPHGHPREFVERFLEQNPDPSESWTLAGDDDLALIAPSMRADAQFRAWWVRASARAASPA